MSGDVTEGCELVVAPGKALRLAMTQVEGWLHGVIIGVMTGRTSFALCPTDESAT